MDEQDSKPEKEVWTPKPNRAYRRKLGKRASVMKGRRERRTTRMINERIRVFWHPELSSESNGRKEKEGK